MVAKVTAEDLRDVWPLLTPDERIAGFAALSREEADDFFLSLSARGQATIIRGAPDAEKRFWLRLLAPDDVADVLQEFEPEERAALLGLVDQATRQDVTALLAYAEDEAGGLMSPRFTRIRPEMSVDEAIRYIRRQVRNQPETIYYVYVLDSEQRLLGVVSFRELLMAPSDRSVREIMETDVVTVPEDMDDEAVADLIARHDLLAVPVLDDEGRMKGIITVDDIVDVVQEGATEDIQKIGGLEALDVPYMQTRLGPMLRKRGGWLAVLFLGELLTASAMARYEESISRAVVLTLFVPLIISSGGNSGSQAATLVIRALALGEVRLRDWWLVIRREVVSGLGLGLILAVLGLARVLLWQAVFHSYGDYALRLAFTVALSLVGVVSWGTVTGSALPLLLRRLGFDPASASAPFVATLVDVAGLVIYFSVAELLLRGPLL